MKQDYMQWHKRILRCHSQLKNSWQLITDDDFKVADSTHFEDKGNKLIERHEYVENEKNVNVFFFHPSSHILRTYNFVSESAVAVRSLGFCLEIQSRLIRLIRGFLYGQIGTM